MFPRRPFLWRHPLVGRPRILGAALVGGVGYALGRSRPQASPPLAAGPSAPSAAGTGVAHSGPDKVAELERLAALHSNGALTDEEFVAAKEMLLR